MIDQGTILPFEKLIPLLGGKIGRGNRATGTCHGGDNPTALCFDEDSGLWYCHRCARGGDKITLVMRSLDVNFKEALAFLGISSEFGRMQPLVLPRRTREATLRQGLNAECRRIGRRLRDDFYHRNRIIAYARKKLAVNPEDELGWALLEVGYKGVALDEIERLLDMINARSDEQKLWAWRVLRSAEKFNER
jgi:hypothetical protein